MKIYCDEENGVNYYLGKNDVACDIDVNTDVTELKICKNIKIDRSTVKTFPNVTSLHICSNVKVLDIPNKLFPNVRKVYSNSPYFKNMSEFLIDNSSGYGNRYLLNTFCRKKNDIINLSGINVIESYAFEDCDSEVIINTDDIYVIKEDAFTGSFFERQPFSNGVKMANDILIALDESSDEVIIPDDIITIKNVNPTVTFKNIKKLVLHNPDTIYRIHSMSMGYPHVMVLSPESEYPLDDYNVRKLMKLDLRGGEQLHQYKLIMERNIKNVIEIDGIVYSADKKRIISGSSRLMDVEIPEGVVSIEYDAFSGTHIRSVKLPSSLKKLGDSSFKDCTHLEKIDFGTGLTKIGSNTFYGCKGLKKIVLPAQIEEIHRNVFQNSGITEAVLNQNLLEIGPSAFYGTNIKEITIPNNHMKTSYFSFGNKLSKIKMCEFNENIIKPLLSEFRPRKENLDKDECAPICIEFKGKKIYIPKFVRRHEASRIQNDVKEYFTCGSDEVSVLDSYSIADDMFRSSISAKISECTAIENYCYLKSIGYDSYFSKTYLKQNSKKIIMHMMEDEDQEEIVRFLKLGFVSKATLKKLLSMTQEKDMTIVTSYILNALGTQKVNSNFAI